jgi:hypothetical protein
MTDTDLHFEDRAKSLQSPIEILLFDGYHRRTEDARGVFRTDESPLAKIVPTRRFKVEKAPHQVLVTILSGIRVHVFYHLKGKTPEDDFVDKHYWDHIHHISRVLGEEIHLSKKQLGIVKTHIKKPKLPPRLSEDDLGAIQKTKALLHRLILVGTTNLMVSQDGEGFSQLTSKAGKQWDLFDEEEQLPPEMISELEAEFDEDEVDMPLFRESRPRFNIDSATWRPGTVADYIPKNLSENTESIRKRISDALEIHFQNAFR